MKRRLRVALIKSLEIGLYYSITLQSEHLFIEYLISYLLAKFLVDINLTREHLEFRVHNNFRTFF